MTKTYPAGTNFMYQTFERNCDFGRDCTFIDCAFGNSTNFERNCKFAGCTFGEVTTFGQNCTLNDCAFTADSIEFWSNCTFNRCTFAECTSFGPYNRFKDCLFLPRVSFGFECEFEGVNHGLIDALAAEKKRTDAVLDAQIANLRGIGGAA